MGWWIAWFVEWPGDHTITGGPKVVFSLGRRNTYPLGDLGGAHCHHCGSGEHGWGHRTHSEVSKESSAMTTDSHPETLGLCLEDHVELLVSSKMVGFGLMGSLGCGATKFRL